MEMERASDDIEAAFVEEEITIRSMDCNCVEAKERAAGNDTKESFTFHFSGIHTADEKC